MSYGYKVILALDGEPEIELQDCHYNYVRQVNERTSKVESKVLLGIIELTFSNHPPQSILEWGMKYKFRDGKIKLCKNDQLKGSFVPDEEVTFIEAACVGLKINYSRISSTHFQTNLTISSNSSKLGDTDDWVNKDWLLKN